MIRRSTAFKSVVLAGVVSLLGACAATPESPVDDRRTQSQADAPQPVRSLSAAQRAAIVATRQVGVPYRYGGSSPAGFDCSGLVHYSFARAGVSVPRTTSQLWSATRTVAAGELREGDLLFFRFGGKMSHVGMYLGNSRFVHAPSSGKRVTVQSLASDVYRDAFVRAGRL